MTPKTARKREIVELREQGSPLTMQEIGNKFSISRERVRQIIISRGRPDLCGATGSQIMRQRHTEILVDLTCANCGKKIKRIPSRAQTQTCSRKCFGELKGLPLEDTCFVMGPVILEMREAGYKWREIDAALKIKSSASGILDGWAKRVGADISHLRTGKHARVKLPLSSR